MYLRNTRLSCSKFQMRPMITKFDNQTHLHYLTQMRLIKQVLVTSSLEDYISTTRVPNATKLAKMVAYLDGLVPIKSYEPLIHHRSAYDHQTWQNGNLPSLASAYKGA